MIIGAIILIAIILGAFVAKNPEMSDNEIIWIIKLVVAAFAPLYLGTGLLGILGVYLIFQTLFIASGNYVAKKDIWFIDQDTWLGQIVVKYLGAGKRAGQILYIGEVIVGIIILFL